MSKHCINELILPSHQLTYINPHMVTCPQTQHPKPITNIGMCSAKGIFKLPNQHVEFLVTDNIVEIQRQSRGSQSRV